MSQRPWPNEKSARAFSMRLDGLTYRQIATEMGVSRSCVAGYLSRHGIAGDLENACLTRGYARRCAGGYDYEVPEGRPNDDRKHLRLMLASLRELRAE